MTEKVMGDWWTQQNNQQQANQTGGWYNSGDWSATGQETSYISGFDDESQYQEQYHPGQSTISSYGHNASSLGQQSAYTTPYTAQSQQRDHYTSNQPTQQQSYYGGGMFIPQQQQQQQQHQQNYPKSTGEGFEDELPLLEELGINFEHIKQKTLAVLNPLKTADASVIHDNDLAGPLVFCLSFGATLLLSGKVQFGYIYGIGVLGCLAIYALLNLMSADGITILCTVSVLGYCMLPMAMLSLLAAVLTLKATVGYVVSAAAILWCSASASKLFVTALALEHQQLLVAYPCSLLYGVFALLAIF